MFAALVFTLTVCDSPARRGASEDGPVGPNCSEWEAAWRRGPIGKLTGFTPTEGEKPGTPSRRLFETSSLGSRGLAGVTVDDSGKVWRWSGAKTRKDADYLLVGKVEPATLAEMSSMRDAAARAELCPERATAISDIDSIGLSAFVWRDDVEVEVRLQRDGDVEQVRASNEALEIARWMKALSLAIQVRGDK